MSGETQRGTVYRGSDGTWYTPWEVDRRLLEGHWRRCLDDHAEGIRLVEPVDGDGPVALVAVDLEALPAWLEVRSDGRCSRVVDTRRGPPPTDA